MTTIWQVFTAEDIELIFPAVFMVKRHIFFPVFSKTAEIKKKKNAVRTCTIVKEIIPNFCCIFSPFVKGLRSAAEHQCGFIAETNVYCQR